MAYPEVTSEPCPKCKDNPKKFNDPNSRGRCSFCGGNPPYCIRCKGVEGLCMACHGDGREHKH